MPVLISEIPRPERPKSHFHDLFLQMTDGRMWLLKRAEYPKSFTPERFRLMIQGWGRTRGMKVETRINAQGDIYVKRAEESFQ